MEVSNNCQENPWKKLAVLVLLVVFMLSCTVLNYSSDQNNSAFPADPRVDRSFLTGQPCEAPCWYGLKLGESTLEDIRRTLPELPFVDSSRTYEQLIGNVGPNEKAFDVHCTYSKEKEFCATLVTSKDGKLSKIAITVAYELTLQMVIEKLGVPKFYTVGPYPNEDICRVVIYWPEKSIAASINDSPRDRLCTRSENEKIDLHSQILTLIYTDISIEDQQKYEGLPWPDSAP
jgi:hypothetical protein